MMNLLEDLITSQFQEVGLQGEVKSKVVNNFSDWEITIIIWYDNLRGKKIYISRVSMSQDNAKETAINRTYKLLFDDLAFGLPMDELTHIKGNTYSANLRTLLSNPNLTL